MHLEQDKRTMAIRAGHTVGPRVPIPLVGLNTLLASASWDHRCPGIKWLSTVARGHFLPAGAPHGPAGKGAVPLGREAAGTRHDSRHLGFISPKQAPLAVAPGPGGGMNVEPQEARPGVAEMCKHAGPWAGSACPVSHGEGHGRHLNLEHEDRWGRPDGFTRSSPDLGWMGPSSQVATFLPCSMGTGFWCRAEGQKQPGPGAELHSLV